MRMPSHEMGLNPAQSHQRLNDSDIPEIRVKTAYNGQVFITYIDHSMTYPHLMEEMRDICGFQAGQELTIKWVDEEGDPCLVQSQTELDEAIRLYEVNKEAELAVHVFPGLPPAPGRLCHGEDRRYEASVQFALNFLVSYRRPVAGLLSTFQILNTGDNFAGVDLGKH